MCLSGCEAKQQSSEESILLGMHEIEERVDVVYQRNHDVWLRKHGSNKGVLLATDAYWPRWSPNGKFVAYFSKDYIKRQNVYTGKVVDIGKAKNGVALAWHPAGNWIYFSTGNQLNRIGSKGKTENLANRINIRELDVSPDGSVIATVKNRGYSVVKLEHGDFKPTRVERGCSASFSPDGELNHLVTE